MNTLHLAGEAMPRVHEGRSRTAAALAAELHRLAPGLPAVPGRPLPGIRTR